MKKTTNSIEQVVKEMERTKQLIDKEIENHRKTVTATQMLIREREEQREAINKILATFSGGNRNSRVQESPISENILENNMGDETKRTRTVLRTRTGTRITKKQLKSYKQKTIIGTIVTMLKDQPMHYKDIIEFLRLLGFSQDGKQPNENMVALLSRDERFERVGRGIYGLREVTNEEGSEEQVS